MEIGHLGGCIIKDNYPQFGRVDVGTWAPQVWDNIITTYSPKSMVDVGCGAGHSLNYFISKGLDSIGVEGYLPAIESSIVKDKIKIHDYADSEFIPERKFDLAWCCEFVEHVDEQYLHNFMKTLDKCDLVAMTHAVPGQPGHHHVNCQVAEYWIDIFMQYKFEFLEEYSLSLRTLLPNWDNNTDVVPNGGHVKNTLMVFKKLIRK
jgi:SAM-dependent methyltransferase